ncbi:hypothetical protein HK097_002837, partial [Rhizophlyctis rosea]
MLFIPFSLSTTLLLILLTLLTYLILSKIASTYLTRVLTARFGFTVRSLGLGSATGIEYIPPTADKPRDLLSSLAKRPINAIKIGSIRLSFNRGSGAIKDVEGAGGAWLSLRVIGARVDVNLPSSSSKKPDKQTHKRSHSASSPSEPIKPGRRPLLTLKKKVDSLTSLARNGILSITVQLIDVRIEDVEVIVRDSQSRELVKWRQEVVGLAFLRGSPSSSPTKTPSTPTTPTTPIFPPPTVRQSVVLHISPLEVTAFGGYELVGKAGGGGVSVFSTDRTSTVVVSGPEGGSSMGAKALGGVGLGVDVRVNGLAVGVGGILALLEVLTREKRFEGSVPKEVKEEGEQEEEPFTEEDISLESLTQILHLKTRLTDIQTIRPSFSVVLSKTSFTYEHIFIPPSSSSSSPTPETTTHPNILATIDEITLSSSVLDQTTPTNSSPSPQKSSDLEVRLSIHKLFIDLYNIQPLQHTTLNIPSLPSHSTCQIFSLDSLTVRAVVPLGDVRDSRGSVVGKVGEGLRRVLHHGSGRKGSTSSEGGEAERKEVLFSVTVDEGRVCGTDWGVWWVGVLVGEWKKRRGAGSVVKKGVEKAKKKKEGKWEEVVRLTLLAELLTIWKPVLRIYINSPGLVLKIRSYNSSSSSSSEFSEDAVIGLGLDSISFNLDVLLATPSPTQQSPTSPTKNQKPSARSRPFTLKFESDARNLYAICGIKPSFASPLNEFMLPAFYDELFICEGVQVNGSGAVPGMGVFEKGRRAEGPGVGGVEVDGAVKVGDMGLDLGRVVKSEVVDYFALGVRVAGVLDE